VTGDPTNGELGRQIGTLHTLLDARFSELNTRLDKVVSLDVYTVQTTHVEQRLAQLGTDIQRATDAGSKLEDDFEAYQRTERDRREDERQKRLYQATVPILVCLVASVIAIWAVIAK
jgi:DNA-binding HxlR family transcriptional regulator